LDGSGSASGDGSQGTAPSRIGRLTLLPPV
jgi:hypothetical protein